MRPTHQGAASLSTARLGSRPSVGTSATAGRGSSLAARPVSARATRCDDAGDFSAITLSIFGPKVSGSRCRRCYSPPGLALLNSQRTSGMIGCMTCAGPQRCSWTISAARWTDSAQVSLRSAYASCWKNAGPSGWRSRPTSRRRTGGQHSTDGLFPGSTGPHAWISPELRIIGRSSKGAHD